MNRFLKGSRWVLSLILLTSYGVYAHQDIHGGNPLRRKLSSAELEAAKQKYIAKLEAKKALEDKAIQPAGKSASSLKTVVAAPQVEDCSRRKPKQKSVRACIVEAENLCAGKANVDTLNVKTNAAIGGDLAVSGNQTVAGDLHVAGNGSFEQGLAVKGDLSVEGTVTGGTIQAHRVDADQGFFKTEVTDVSYEDVNVIEDLRVWQTERFVTPNYDRFPEGALPQTTKIGPGETYAYTSFTPNYVPQIGNDWTAIIHGIIDFDSASPKEKLDFYSGAHYRLFTLMLGEAFSATEKDIKPGSTNDTVMPLDQQKYAAQALREIRKGLLGINPDDLVEAKDKVTLFNNITQADFYIQAWESGTSTTDIIGGEYFGSPNPANLGNYYYQAAYYPNGFLNVALLTVYGINTDGPALLPYARALPGLYKLFPSFLKSQVDTALKGLKEGYYPHVLRNRPYSSPGQSTFGEVAFGYTPEVAALVATGQFPPEDDPRIFALQDYLDLSAASFEDQLDPNLLFRGLFTIEGLNPLPFLDMLVEQGVMDQSEADYIQEEARKTYDTAVKPALLNFLSQLYIDEASPLVRALRLTRYDDTPGEWGYKYIVNAEGHVKGIVKNGIHTGQTVYIDVLGEDVVVTLDGNPVNISLADITLQRDIAAGNEQYTNMTEIVLKLNRTTPIPYYVKISDSGETPFDNWEVQFDDRADVSVVEKLHESGSSLLIFFEEAINFYLDQWVTEAFPPYTTWQSVIDPNTGEPMFPTLQSAIDAITDAGRLVGDLEDPANGGIWAFVQHYRPISDEQGNPLFDFSILENYYTDAWDGVPQLKTTQFEGRTIVDGPQIVALIDFGPFTKGEVLYDPKATPVDGLVPLAKLNAATEVDPAKASYYRFMSSTDIVAGKAARVYYFFYDFVKRSFENYLTLGDNPLMPYYFSPYATDAFNKLSAHTYLNLQFASGSSYDPTSQVITYTHLMNFRDPRNSADNGAGTRSTLLHEFIMGHAIQIPLLDMVASTGTSSWITAAVSNNATAEGWAVFIELFFGGLYTNYLSTTDRYFNYIDPTGKPDPKVIVPQLTGASRIAARLKWDTGIHYNNGKPEFGVTLAEYAQGFEKDTFGAFPITSEISQRIPVSPTQGLNYALGYLQILGKFQQLPQALGQELYDQLQADGNKATRYFFDLILLGGAGYFISSLDPLYDNMIERIKLGIPPATDFGYGVDAFDAHTVAYVPGTNPGAYEFSDNPYKPGGFTFVFPSCPVPNDGVTCPSPTGAVMKAPVKKDAPTAPASKGAVTAKVLPKQAPKAVSPALNLGKKVAAAKMAKKGK